MAVVILVLAVEVPIGANLDPAATIRAAQDAQTVLVTTDSLVPTPEPTGRLVVVIALPEVPV